MKLLSTSFSLKDLVCEYHMDNVKFEGLTKNLKEQVNFTFFKLLGSEEFKKDVVHKPIKSIKEIKIETAGLFECNDFEKAKKSKLKLIGAYQTSKHSSHHILSATMMNKSYIITGHSDSTFKVWNLNPSYFNTPQASASIKPIASKDLLGDDVAKQQKGGHKPFDLVSHSKFSYLYPKPKTSTNTT